MRADSLASVSLAAVPAPRASSPPSAVPAPSAFGAALQRQWAAQQASFASAAPLAADVEAGPRPDGSAPAPTASPPPAASPAPAAAGPDASSSSEPASAPQDEDASAAEAASPGTPTPPRRAPAGTAKAHRPDAVRQHRDIRPDDGQSRGTADAKAADAARDDGDRQDTTPDAALPPWLAALQWAPPPAETTTRVAGASSGAATPASTDAAPDPRPAKPSDIDLGASTPTTARGDATAALAAKGRDHADGPDRDAKDAPSPLPMAAPITAATANDALRPARGEGAVAPANFDLARLVPATPMAAGSPVATSAGGDAPPVRSSIDVPIDAPGFDDALGAQVSLFAADGVQQAELHLNPAETGPIHVRIALDNTTDGGALARVEFHAELQATRDAIEASLPGLAASMREQGLTLAGGGVFQGSPGRGGGNGNEGGDRDAVPRRDSEADIKPSRLDASPATTRRAVRAGGLDVYA